MISVYQPESETRTKIKDLEEKVDLFFDVKMSPYNTQNSSDKWSTFNACFVYNGKIFRIRTQDLNPIFKPLFEITDDPIGVMSEAAGWPHVARLRAKRRLMAAGSPDLPIQTNPLKVTGKAFRDIIKSALRYRLDVPIFEIKQANRVSNAFKSPDQRGRIQLDQKYCIKFRTTPHSWAESFNSREFLNIIKR